MSITEKHNEIKTKLVVWLVFTMLEFAFGLFQFSSKTQFSEGLIFSTFAIMTALISVWLFYDGGIVKK